MKFKHQLLGVISSFLFVGTLVSASSDSAYQKVYESQSKEEKRMEEVIDSEFIDSKDKQDLTNKIIEFNQVKESKTKKELTRLIEEEKQQRLMVEDKLVDNEKKVAVNEYQFLKTDLEELEIKSKEPFVLGSDVNTTTELKKEILRLNDTEKVEPIRELASEVAELDKELVSNQRQLIEQVDSLKDLNETNKKLIKHHYLLQSDKKELENDSKKNSEFFKDADDFIVLEERFSESEKIIDLVQTRIKDTEKDFKDNENQTKNLIGQAQKLVDEGDLTTEEKEKLQTYFSLLNSRLEFKDYQPGDLKKNYDLLKIDFEDYNKLSQGRIKKAKELAEKEAKEQLKREEEARQKAEQEAERLAQENAQNQNPGPATVSGGWTQAPSGFKYLKVESGKTYGQVKNPGNFILITVEEAASYSPGHGNGSAKQ